MTGDPFLFATLNALVPVFVTAVIFGTPILYVFLSRHLRLREKEMDLRFDRRLASAEQERDTLRIDLEKAESELEFLRRLVPSLEQRTRVAPAPEIRVTEKREEELAEDAAPEPNARERAAR